MSKTGLEMDCDSDLGCSLVGSFAAVEVRYFVVCTSERSGTGEGALGSRANSLSVG